MNTPNGQESTEPVHAATEPAVTHQWHRLHPLSPLLRGGLFFIVIFAIAIANLRDRLFALVIPADYMRSEGDLLDLVDVLAERQLIIWALVALVLFGMLVVLLAWLSWRFSTYRITEDAVESRRGVVFRRHRRAPLERIQSVNLQRNLLARIFGLTQLDIQTAGHGGKVELQYLGYRVAKDVRESILLAVSTARGEIAQAVPVAADATDIFAHATDQASVQAFAQPTVQASAQLGTVLQTRLHDAIDQDIDPAAHTTGTLVRVPVTRLIGSIALSAEVLVGIAVIVGAVLVMIWFGPVSLSLIVPTVFILGSIVVMQFNKCFNFVLSRSAEGLRIGAGLTETVTETIPFGRVHAIEVQQPIGWRPLGWWRVKITTAGFSFTDGGQNGLRNLVLPVGTIDDALTVVETLLHQDSEQAAERRQDLRDAILGDGAGFLSTGRRSGWLLGLGRKRTGIRIEDEHSPEANLQIRRGWFIRSLVVMPLRRAQSVQFDRPIGHLPLGLARIQGHTVPGPVLVQIRGLDLAAAREIFEQLVAAVMRVQGTELRTQAETHITEDYS